MEFFYFLSVFGDAIPTLHIPFGNSGGVDIIIEDLDYKSGNYGEETKYLFTIVDCIWSCVALCDENEQLFLDQGGVFKLLDLLAVHKDRALIGHILGCLVDMFDNTRAIQHTLAWKSKSTHHNISKVLIQKWKIEEETLKSKKLLCIGS